MVVRVNTNATISCSLKCARARSKTASCTLVKLAKIAISPVLGKGLTELHPRPPAQCFRRYARNTMNLGEQDQTLDDRGKVAVTTGEFNENAFSLRTMIFSGSMCEVPTVWHE